MGHEDPQCRGAGPPLRIPAGQAPGRRLRERRRSLAGRAGARREQGHLHDPRAQRAAGHPRPRGRHRGDVLRRVRHAAAPRPVVRAQPAVAGAGAAAATDPPGRRHRALRPAARRPAQPRHRGQRAPGRDRGMPAAFRSRRGRHQRPDALHLRRRADPGRGRRRRDRGLRAAARARPAHARCRQPGHRRAGRQPGRRRRHPADGHRRGPGRDAQRAHRSPRSSGVDRDVLRRRARARPGGRARPAPPPHRILRLRLARALRLGRRQPPGADDAHRAHQRPRPDRPAADDDLGQHRTRGRPVRAGQRLADQRPHLLRLRRADRLHRRGAALLGRAVVHRAALVAPQGRRVDGRAARRRAGHELPAERDRHRARHRRAVGLRPAAQCRHIIRDAAHPQVRDELWEEAAHLGLA